MDSRRWEPVAMSEVADAVLLGVASFHPQQDVQIRIPTSDVWGCICHSLASGCPVGHFCLHQFDRWKILSQCCFNWTSSVMSMNILFMHLSAIFKYFSGELPDCGFSHICLTVVSCSLVLELFTELLALCDISGKLFLPAWQCLSTLCMALFPGRT